MNGLLFLSLRHVRHHLGRTAILVACIALSLYLPIASRVLVQSWEQELRQRAQDTPLVAGAKGSRVDLTLSSLFFRSTDLDAIHLDVLKELRAENRGMAVPLHVRFSARGHPIVGTSLEYFEQRGLRPASGSLPLQLGDVVLGSEVADELELGTGDALLSDAIGGYNIALPPPLRMRVCGVLPPTGLPEDRAVLVDLGTIWILEGLAHGHQEAASIDSSLILGETEDHVAFSPALIPYLEVTEENLASFHFHGEDEDLPLTAVLVFPDRDKDRTILKAKWGHHDICQIVEPTDVVDELLSFVFRIKAIVDGLALFLGLSTAALTSLVMLLSVMPLYILSNYFIYKNIGY